MFLWGQQIQDKAGEGSWLTGAAARGPAGTARNVMRSPHIHSGIQLYLFYRGYSKVFTKEAVYFYPHGAGEVSSTEEGRVSHWLSQDRAAAALWLDTRTESCPHWHFPQTSTGWGIPSIASMLALQRRQRFHLILLFFVSYRRNQCFYAPNQVWAKQP